MTEAIERMARAQEAALKQFFDERRANVEWDYDEGRVLVDAVFSMDDLTAVLARAAMLALREPTPVMVEAMARALCLDDNPEMPPEWQDIAWPDYSEHARVGWQAGIDAAMGDG